TGPTMDVDEHRRTLADYNRWRAASDAHRATADLIWPLAGDGATRLQKHLDEIARTLGAPMGRPHEAALPIFTMIAIEATTTSYLLNAGYAVETLLKATRVKRLVLKNKRITFGGGPDQLPKRHEYVQLAA